MTLPLLALLLTAAALHAGWNVLLKRAPDRPLIVWWAVVVSALCFVALTTAYRVADFSLVYPIARGAAPALLAVAAVLLLHERLSAYGIAGLGAIVVGLWLVAGTGRAAGPYPARGVALELLVALCN